MKSLVLLLLLSLLKLGGLFAQDITVYNQLNEFGKKTGLWSRTLDSNLRPTHSADFKYVGYEAFDNGRELFHFVSDKWMNKSTVEFEPDSTFSPINKILSGTVTYKNEQGNVVVLRKFYKGNPHYLEIRYWNKENKSYVGFKIYYDQLWNNEFGTHKNERWNHHNRLTETSWFKNGKHGWQFYHEQDPKNPTKYPYVGKNTPPLIGAIFGYNFYKTKQIEMGIIYNSSDNTGGGNGTILGPSLIYKRDLNEKINSIDLDYGFYSPLSFGLGVNYNFRGNDAVLGFRPTIGISFYHFQLMYGYNMMTENKNLNLEHHSIKLRMVIPVKSFKYFVEK